MVTSKSVQLTLIFQLPLLLLVCNMWLPPEGCTLTVSVYVLDRSTLREFLLKVKLVQNRNRQPDEAWYQKGNITGAKARL